MLWPVASKARVSQSTKPMCLSCRVAEHNTRVQLNLLGGAGLLASHEGFRAPLWGLHHLSTPSEERCGMKFENTSKIASQMPAWELLKTKCHQADLGGKPDLIFQHWKLLLLGSVIMETELA